MGIELKLVVALAVAGALRCTSVYGQVSNCKYPYSMHTVYILSVILKFESTGGRLILVLNGQ